MEFVTVVLWSMDLPGVYILSRLAFSVKIERSRVCPNTSKLPSSTKLNAFQNGGRDSPEGKSLRKFTSVCLKVELNAGYAKDFAFVPMCILSILNSM